MTSKRFDNEAGPSRVSFPGMGLQGQEHAAWKRYGLDRLLLAELRMLSLGSNQASKIS